MHIGVIRISFSVICKGSQLGAFCPSKGYYSALCYLEFKLRYHKNQKLFSNRVKELFEPLVFWKKSDVFLLFLKAFSWETYLWVMLRDFTIKNAKLRREICIQLKISEVEMKCHVLQISQSHASPMCKRIFRVEIQLSSYWQNIEFSRNCPKFDIKFTKILFFSIFATF